MKKTLILIRHAHRDTSRGRELDNGLSVTGKEQARRLARYYAKRLGQDRVLLISSPKKRCLQTLLPITKNHPNRLRVSTDVDEGAGLNRRVAAFVKWWRAKAPANTVVCSHGDWIPECVRALTGVRVKLKKGGWLEIELEGRQAALTWVLQRVCSGC